MHLLNHFTSISLWVWLNIFHFWSVKGEVTKRSSFMTRSSAMTNCERHLWSVKCGVYGIKDYSCQALRWVRCYYIEGRQFSASEMNWHPVLHCASSLQDSLQTPVTLHRTGSYRKWKDEWMDQRMDGFPCIIEIFLEMFSAFCILKR